MKIKGDVLAVLYPTLWLQLFMFNYELGLVGVVVGLYHLTLICYRMFRQPKEIRPWKFLLVPLSFLLVFGFYKLTLLFGDNGDKNGMMLYDEIAKYRQETGVYPKKLSDLKPGYVDHVPFYWRGIIPVGYTYTTQANSSFGLSISKGDLGKCTFGDAGTMECSYW